MRSAHETRDTDKAGETRHGQMMEGSVWVHTKIEKNQKSHTLIIYNNNEYQTFENSASNKTSYNNRSTTYSLQSLFGRFSSTYTQPSGLFFCFLWFQFISLECSSLKLWRHLYSSSLFLIVDLKCPIVLGRLQRNSLNRYDRLCKYQIHQILLPVVYCEPQQ
jgi:hypothetical protein